MGRAKAEGAMRADAGPFDVPVMMIGVSAVMQTLPGEEPWRRYIAAHARRAPRVVVFRGMAAPDVADPELDGIAWDLDPLLDGAGEGAAGVEALLADAQRRADAFAEEHAGKVAALDGPGLAAAMRELAALNELVGRAGSYAMLNFTTATADPERGALLQLVQERATQVETELLFFELEWAALDDARADELLAHDEPRLLPVTTCAPPAATGRTCSPSRRSGSSPRSRSRRTARGRGSSRSRRPSIQVTLPEGGEPVALEIALARLFSPDREVRRTSAEAVTGALAPGLRVARLRAQHAARRQDGRRPAALLPALAGRPQPRQRGLRRVRRAR